MPIAEVQLPNGKIAQYEVPDNTSPDDVVKFATQHYQEMQPANESAPAPVNTSIPNNIGTALARTGRDIVGGLGDIADTGYAAVAPIYQGLRALAGQTDLGSYMEAPQNTQQYAPSTALKALYDSATNNTGVPQNNSQAITDKASEMLASGGLAGLISKAPQVASAGQNMLGMMAPQNLSQGLSFAGAGGGSEVARQQYPDSSVAPIVGALAGGAAPAAGSLANVGKQVAQEGLAKVGAAVLPGVPENIESLAQKALDYNIPLSRIQISESLPTKTISSAINKIPLSGASSFADEQQKAFNREVLSTIGANSDKVTPDIISSSLNKIGNQFDSALSGQKVKITSDMIDKLDDIEKNAQNDLTPDHAKVISNQVNKFMGMLNPDGTINGEKLGDMRSTLSKMSTQQGYPSSQIMDLKNFVQDVSVDGAPLRKAQLQDAIQKYRHYSIIEPLLDKAVTGNISPALLLSKVAANYSDFASGGGGKLGDLARIGTAFLKEKAPDSGTAQRALVYKVMQAAPVVAAGGYAGGLPAAAATAVLPIAGARALNALNNSQRLVRNTVGMASPINIPGNISNLPPGAALQALLEGQRK